MGQKQTLKRLHPYVRFTPKSGHRSTRRQCPLCAKSGLMHRSKQALVKSLTGKRAAGEKRVDSFLRNTPVREGLAVLIGGFPIFQLLQIT